MKTANLQIIVLKAFRHQKPPIIVIQDSGNKSNKIVFGGLSEPALRYIQFYKINPFEEGQTYFFTRSSINYLDGISPLVLQSFSRNKFLGMTLFGPSGLCEFMTKLYNLIGVRYLLFAAMDLPSGLHKLGIKQLNTFTEQLKIDKSLKDLLQQRYNLTVQKSNDYLLKNRSKIELQDPTTMINKGCITSKQFGIYPIENSHNDKLLNYFVVPKVEFKWNQAKLLEDKFPMPFIPELSSQKSFSWQGKVFKKEDYKIFTKQQSILLLDLQPEEVDHFDMDRLFSLTEEQYQFKSLLVIHMTTKSSLESLEYEQFVTKLEASFKGKCNLIHLILDETFYTNMNDSLERDKIEYPNLEFNNKLHKLLPSIFPNVQLDSSNYKKLPDQTLLDDLWKNINVQKILTRKTYALEMEQGEISFEKVNKLGAPQIIFTDQEVVQLKMAYQNIQNIPVVQKSRIQITFLGTSASVPTQYSNVQSFLIAIDFTKILIDCGSNTFYQLFCCFGNDIKKILKEIKIVYISHFHGDHHLGLIQLLTKRLELIEEEIEPLNIIIPQNLLNWYTPLLTQLVETLRPKRKQNEFFNLVLINDFVSQFKTRQNLNLRVMDILKEVNLSLSPFPVKHCHYSTGIHLKDLESNEQICFTCDRDGRIDPKDNQDFLKMSQDCDVLIHECTFPDTQIDKAKLVNHSSFSQAIQAGLNANAKILVLSHYTTACQNYIQRLINKSGQFDSDMYERQLQSISSDIQYKTPEMLQYLTDRTVFATDLMTVHTSDLKNMPHLSRLIYSVFPNS